MAAEVPYRVFPALDDLQRAGLFLPAQAPELLTISASADEDCRPPRRPDHRRRSGEVNEVQFAIDAMRHDYTCGKPYTNEAFDLFVIPRDFERLIARVPRSGPVMARAGQSSSRRNVRVAIAPVALVQVRSTASMMTRNSDGKPFYVISARHGYGKRRYTADEIDIFAAYIEPLKLWYIIPFAEIGTAASLSLFPHDPRSQGKYEKFRERWDLLRL